MPVKGLGKGGGEKSWFKGEPMITKKKTKGFESFCPQSIAENERTDGLNRVVQAPLQGGIALRKLGVESAACPQRFHRSHSDG